MMTLEQLCYNSIGESVVNAPPLIQELIYKKSKKKYENTIKERLKKELKAELRDELRTEIMEELMEKYLGIIPSLVEEATEKLLSEENKSERNIKNLIKSESFFIDDEILDVAVKSAKKSSEVFKNLHSGRSRVYYFNNLESWYPSDEDEYL